MADPNEREINRLFISERDFEQSIRFLKTLIEIGLPEYSAKRDTIREALLLSAIVSYARPFSNNEKKDDARAAPNIADDVLVDISEDERALHNQVRKLRNKAIAHSEWMYNPTELNPNGVFIGKEFGIWAHFCPEQVEQFLSLSTNVLNKTCSLKTDKAREVLQERS